MPRVLVDARVIQDHFPGIGRYAFHLLDALPPLWEGDLLALVNPRAVNTRYDLALLERHPNLHLIPTSLGIFHWRSQTHLPRLLAELAPDLIHFPYYVRPLRGPGPTLLNLHDVIPRRFPQYFPRLTRWKIEIIQRLAIRQSQAFITASQAAAHDFAHFYHVPLDRVTIIPYAPDPRFHPRPAPALAAFRQRRGLPGAYALYLGANKPHKNLPRLVQAWREVVDAHPQAHLVIAGHWDPRYPQARVLAQNLGLTHHVHFLGPVPGEDLPWLYAAARLFVFPSLYEGFGLPVLEAMASGVAVVCSRAPGLSEVAGEAARTFDPLDVEAMARALIAVWADESLRGQLREAGLARAAQFTWPQVARRTAQTYLRVLQG